MKIWPKELKLVVFQMKGHIHFSRGDNNMKENIF